MMLAVVHIHKTAGTTLAGVLKHSNGGTHCDVLAEDPQAPYFSAEDLRRLRRFYPRLRSILGHDVRAYSDLETVVPDIEWVCFLREPLTRTASHFQYDVQRGGVDLPFEEWITHDAVRDRQTRILAGPGGTAEEAIDLLGRFALVGLTERFDESLVMLGRKVGLRDLRYARKWVAPSNDIKTRLLADPETREMLVAVNREDLAVYEHVLAEIYPKQKAEYGIGLDTDVAWFRRRNQGVTQRRMYATPRYAAYVAKWRWAYHPWVERRRRHAAAIPS
ncbi:MAG: hypothetical protein JW785_06075 [Acidimicrobiia bacterium]|nr:hypothetical protein [Acidimicrobiia bacterium]